MGPNGWPYPFGISFPTLSYDFGGLTMGGPTGGSKGVGTINVSGGYYVNGSPVAPRVQVDVLTIATLNTIPALSQVSNGALFLLFASGIFIDPTNYTVSGSTVTWTSSGQGLAVGDKVSCVYTY